MPDILDIRNQYLVNKTDGYHEKTVVPNPLVTLSWACIKLGIGTSCKSWSLSLFHPDFPTSRQLSPPNWALREKLAQVAVFSCPGLHLVQLKQL